MQQIYPEAIGDFEKIIESEFQRDFSLVNNWRSQFYIVEIMNKLYFDSRYIQEAKNLPLDKPVINIVSDLNGIEFEDDVLQLVLLNSDLFKAINAYNLYVAYRIRYPQHHKYKVKDILSDLTLNNYDDLMRILFFILKICDLYEQKKFTELIDLSKKPTFFNTQVWNIKNHIEKLQLNEEINNLVRFVKKDINIGECLEYLSENNLFIKSSINEVIENICSEEKFNEKIVEIKFIEVVNCYREMKTPKFSTQHAVKGEGHEKVAIKISDGNSANVNVKMYFFLELFSKNLFDYFKIKEMCEKINKANEIFIQKTSIKASSSELKKDLFNVLKESCDELIENLEEAILLDKKIYSMFYEEYFLKYKSKPGVTAFKNCIKESQKIIAVMLAYKLFYVGCSRAKKELAVYLSARSISNYKKELISKFEEIGFKISINIKYENELL